MRRLIVILIVLSVGFVPAVQAQDPPGDTPQAVPPPVLEERASLRLGYGTVVRSGSQEDAGPGLTYRGVTPNSLWLRSSWFGLGWLGASVGLEREAFSLFGEAGRVTGGSLVKASLGPTGRFALGSLRLDVGLVYGFSQLPYFGRSSAPSFAAGVRHALELDTRVRLPLPPPVRVELRGNLPLSLSASDGERRRARASGLVLGATVTFPLQRGEVFGTSLLLDAQVSSDRLATLGEDRVTSTQSLLRVGAALEVAWLLPASAHLVGDLLVQVVDAESGAPVGKATLELSGAEPRTVTSAADGRARVERLPAGTVTARASAPGYLAGEATASVEAGQTRSVEVRLRPEPRTGGIAVALLDKQTGAPVPEAVVKVQGREVPVGPAGQVEIGGLPAGPVPLVVSAPGYVQVEEVASVVAGKVSRFGLEMVKEAAREPASLTGLVRSTRGGRPIAALLEIPQAKIKTRANTAGAFTIRLPGGTYSVIISAPGYLTQTKTVTVNDGEQAIFNVDLHPGRRSGKGE